MKVLKTLAAIALLATGCDNSTNTYVTLDLSVSGPQPTPSPACTAGAKECIDDGIFRLCHDDGTWGADQPCADGTVCDSGDCKVPPPSMQSCFPGDVQCVPGMANMIFNCRAAGDGFDATACPANTVCDSASGGCAGACGAVGGTLCGADPSTIQTCDGNVLTSAPCPTGQLCVTDADGFDSCLAADCDPRTACVVCGDPKLPSVDPGSTISFCGATPLGFKWQPQKCPAPNNVCDPKGGGACAEGGAGTLNATCSASVGAVCSPGQQRCSADFLSTQTCDATGHWTTTKQCSATADEFCMPDPTDPFNGVICGDEVCATGAPGACVLVAGVSKIEPCDNTGHLGAAVACAGVCTPAGATTFAGLQPGSCTPQCKEGETRCVVGNATSAIQSCSNGVWSSQTTACQTDGGAASVICVDTSDPDSGKKGAFCGVCTPGTHRCTNGGGAPDAGATLPFVETCKADGSWGAPDLCTIGVCRGNPGSASCRVACVPGQTVCVGAILPAASPAPLNFGRRAAVTCNTDGTVPPTPTCPAGAGCCQPVGGQPTSCRRDTANNALGCVICVGSTTNESGMIDSRCTDAAGTGQSGSNQVCGDAQHVSIESCKPDNTWGPPQSCGTDMTCLDPGTVATATSVFCAPCAGGESGLDACTDDNLQAVGFTGCTDPFLNAGAGYGASSANCGGTVNCCHQACAVEPGQPAACFPSEEC